MGNSHNFPKEYTTLQLERKDGWLIARHIEDDSLPTIAFRADMDAIPGESGPRHGCGHDGHSAVLCGLALELEGMKLGKNICLIFQHAEETGAGAKMIADGLSSVDVIFGLHNIPGHPKGTLLIRDECFACASCGMIEDILNGSDRLLMHTVVGLNLGGENFGLSASEGKLCLTLRGHRQADIDMLIESVKARAETLCACRDMSYTFELRDVFPDTTNHEAAVSEACKIWKQAGMPMKTLAEPMRWSEDFGWYLKKFPGMFFGIGSGENAPGLHTADYEFDDGLIEPAVDAFMTLARNIAL